MNSEDLIRFREELLEETSIKELKEEKFRAELSKTMVTINEILNLVKLPRLTYEMNRDTNKIKEKIKQEKEVEA